MIQIGQNYIPRTEYGKAVEEEALAEPLTGRFFANMPGKRLRPRRGGSGWDVGWGPLWSPFVLPSTAPRATTRVPTQPITTPAPTGTRGLLPKKPTRESLAEPSPYTATEREMKRWKFLRYLMDRGAFADDLTPLQTVRE